MKPVHRIAVASLALALAACAPGPRAPMQAQTSAVAALKSAEAMGADEDPRAAYHVAIAHERLNAALGLIEEDEDEAAAIHLDSARAHAELAIALAREAQLVAGAPAPGGEDVTTTASYR